MNILNQFWTRNLRIGRKKRNICVYRQYFYLFSTVLLILKKCTRNLILKRILICFSTCGKKEGWSLSEF